MIDLGTVSYTHLDVYKRQVLGRHAGSAGLFSTVADLERFLEHYLKDDFARDLSQNFAREEGKTRALGWNLEGDWLDHTGYTCLLYTSASRPQPLRDHDDFGG